ncbi:MAG: hypothetical protein PHS82_08485 [Lachnospiraceae bacterium]|nr:hypothetical protein [Lachnospiraceae bacterium]
MRLKRGMCFLLVLMLVLGNVFPVLAAEEGEIQQKAEEKPEDTGQTVEAPAVPVHLGIDTEHEYEGMNAPFSKGYQATDTDGKVQITVPFCADGDLQKDQIKVAVKLGDEKQAPFVFKSIEKTVRQSAVAFGEESS